MTKRTAILCLAILILAVSSAATLSLVPVVIGDIAPAGPDHAPSLNATQGSDGPTVDPALREILLVRGPPASLLQT